MKEDAWALRMEELKKEVLRLRRTRKVNRFSRISVVVEEQEELRE